MTSLLPSIRIPAAAFALVVPLLSSCTRAQDAAPAAPAQAKATFADRLTFDRTAINREASAPMSFAPMLKKVRPSIVTIFTGVETVQRTRLSREDLLMMRFYGLPIPEAGGEGKHRWQQLGVGSGVIVTQDGYIITNRHVILPPDIESTGMSQSQYMDAMQLRVTMPGREGHLTAELVDLSRDKDVAVIKITGSDYPAARLADSNTVEVGDRVFALGAPFGINETVTEGIVSAKRNDEVLEGFEKQELIQTDASINPGNSGGPLVDTLGRVIGINTAIYSRTGSNLGIGFAIPINQAVEAADALSKPRGFLGVSLRPVNQRAARIYGFKGGAFVEGLEEGSPGAKAGLKPGDVILSFHGKPVENDEDLRTRISGLAPGTQVKAEVFRDEQRGEFTITLGEKENRFKLNNRPADDGNVANSDLMEKEAAAPEAKPGAGEKPAPSEKAAAPVGAHGMKVREVSAADRTALSLEADAQGVSIDAVAANSPAANSGLKPGQVILKINDAVPASPEAAQAALDQAKGTVLLQIKDEGARRLLILEIP